MLRMILCKRQLISHFNILGLIVCLFNVSLEVAHHHDQPSVRAALISQRKGCKRLRTAVHFTNIRQPVIYPPISSESSQKLEH